MKTLTLKNKFQTNATLVANDFIDRYMSKANGEFVKVYLFLLRHLNDPCSSITISTIADCLNNTENDILRAFKYWEDEGLLVLGKDGEGKISGIELVQTSAPFTKNTPAQEEKAAPPKSVSAPKAIPLKSFKAQKELKSLLFIAEQYLKKTLSRTDIDTITFFYDELELSADVIEYLIESCVENGHKSIHYMQKVALSWVESHITTVEQAKELSAGYNKNCYTVLNTFGIKGRSPAPAEVVYIQKWTGEYGFTLDIIQEACNRTISATHQASFEYADGILKKWCENNVRHLADITVLDDAFQKSKSVKKETVVKSKQANNAFNNFEGRTYDMDSLEEKLLNSN